MLDDPALEDVAEKRDASIPQVTLAWLRDLDDIVAIPKATGEEHLRDNWDAYDVDLDQDDHDRIAELDRGHREVDFAGAPWDN